MYNTYMYYFKKGMHAHITRRAFIFSEVAVHQEFKNVAINTLEGTLETPYELLKELPRKFKIIHCPSFLSRPSTFWKTFNFFMEKVIL